MLVFEQYSYNECLFMSVMVQIFHEVKDELFYSIR